MRCGIQDRVPHVSPLLRDVGRRLLPPQQGNDRLQQFAGVYDLRLPPFAAEMALVAGPDVVRLGGFGVFQEAIVCRIDHASLSAADLPAAVIR